MRTIGVVLLLPVCDKDSGLQEGVELLEGKQFLSHPRAIGLDPGVLPWAAGFDVAGAGTGEVAPVREGVGGQLGPVVAADELGSASLGDELVETATVRSASIE